MTEKGADGIGGRRRLEDQPGRQAKPADGGQRGRHVAFGLDVEGNRIGPGLGEPLGVAVGVRQHQVDVEAEFDGPADGGNHVGSKRQVRDEVAVHDVDMQGVAARGLGPPGAVREVAEIGGQQRWKDFNVHQATVSQKRP